MIALHRPKMVSGEHLLQVCGQCMMDLLAVLFSFSLLSNDLNF